MGGGEEEKRVLKPLLESSLHEYMLKVVCVRVKMKNALGRKKERSSRRK